MTSVGVPSDDVATLVSSSSSSSLSHLSNNFPPQQLDGGGHSSSTFQHQQQNPAANSSSFVPSERDQLANRKRRRAVNLDRIAIGKLSTSNESLNSGGAGSGSEDDSATAAPLGVVDDENSQPGWSVTDQKRFCSQKTVVAIVAGSSANSQEEPAGDELAVVECSQSGSTSVKAQSVASGGLLIGNGLYEIVGDGRECKAVNIRDKTIFHCLIMKPDEYLGFLNVLERLQTAERTYSDKEEYQTLKNLLIPADTKPIFGGQTGNWYVLLPDHQGNLHSLVRSASSDTASANKICSERRVQPIFHQIVTLVAFCHRIGIYFRDFRLRKFVFTDKEKTKIRLNNVLDLWVAPQVGDDQISQRYKNQVCPVYVAPEILEQGSYAGQPADVWALGVMMFSLLMGRFPFHDPNGPTALFKRIKTRRFSCPIDERISCNARWLLHSLLRQVPGDRPKAAEILQWHWLRAESSSLPDAHDLRAVQTKSGGALTMNSQSVFSTVISSSTTSLSRSLSSTLENANRSDSLQPQGAPPAFVRLNSGPPANGGSLLPLQQAAMMQPPAIHVRLALIAPRGSSPIFQTRDLSPPAPLAGSSHSDQTTDQTVPLPGHHHHQDQNSSPSNVSAPSSSSLGDGITLTVSDHYYTRGSSASANATLSLQSFPSTGMIASTISPLAGGNHRPSISVLRNLHGE